MCCVAYTVYIAVIVVINFSPHKIHEFSGHRRDVDCTALATFHSRVREREREREKFINHIQSMKQCKTMTIN